jgi:hypothetical protein
MREVKLGIRSWLVLSSALLLVAVGARAAAPAFDLAPAAPAGDGLKALWLAPDAPATLAEVELLAEEWAALAGDPGEVVLVQEHFAGLLYEVLVLPFAQPEAVEAHGNPPGGQGNPGGPNPNGGNPGGGNPPGGNPGR